MSTSPIGTPRSRAVLLTLVLVAPLLAAGCSYKPYPPPGKSFQATLQPSPAPQAKQAAQVAPAAPPASTPEALPASTETAAGPAARAAVTAPEIAASEPAAAAPATTRSTPDGAGSAQAEGFAVALPTRAGAAETPPLQPAKAAGNRSSAASALRFAAGRGEAQLATQKHAQQDQPASPAAAPQASEVADPPMPSQPLGKATASQALQEDKAAERAMIREAAWKPRPEATAPSEPQRGPVAEPEPALQAAEPAAAAARLAAPPIVAPAAAALVAAVPRPIVPKPVAPAAPAAPKAAAPKTAAPARPAPAAPATAATDEDTLRERAAELFLETEAAPATAPTSKSEAKTTVEIPTAAAPQPAQPPAPIQPAPEAPAARAPAPAAAPAASPAALPEISVREVPIKLPPKSGAERDTAEELPAAAEVAPAAGSASSNVEIAKPSGQTRVLFEEASAALSEEAQSELAELASRIIDAAQVRITILGYGDGSAQSENAGRERVLALSRVMAVRQYLMVRGLPPERLVARAMGSKKASGPASRVDVMVSQL